MSKAGLTVKASELKRLRVAALLTQRELAEKADLSVARIKQLETTDHRCLVNNVRALALALNCDASAFTVELEEVAS